MMEVGEEALCLLTVPEVATRLRLSEVTVWRLIRTCGRTRTRERAWSRSSPAARRRVPPEAVAGLPRRNVLEESRQGAA